MKKVESKPISFTEARVVLETIPEESLGYEQKITLEYLRTQPKLTDGELKSAREELQGIADVKEHHVALLLSIFPKTVEEVKTLFMKERVSLEEPAIKQVLEALDKVRPIAK